MSAPVSDRTGGAPPGRTTRAGRTALVVCGIAAVAVGVVLLFNPTAAARTLALLVGLALVLGGLLEVSAALAGGRSGWGVLLGLVLVVGGVIAAVWPGITLWSLAVITGIALLVHGVARLALAVAVRRETPGWGWLAVAGLLNAVVGVLALAWPEATVLVLSVLFGAQVLVFGGLLLVTAALLPRPVPAGR
ncbi:HdeD family acid-resistance protein [Geodermatophilus sp. SYSU D00758]